MRSPLPTPSALAGVPEKVLFATKPQLAGALLDRAQSPEIRAAFVAGDEVYGGVPVLWCGTDVLIDPGDNLGRTS
jgi:hypothetical protein